MRYFCFILSCLLAVSCSAGLNSAGMEEGVWYGPSSYTPDPRPENSAQPNREVQPDAVSEQAVDQAMSQDSLISADIKRCKSLKIPENHHVFFKNTNNYCVADRNGQKSLKIHPRHRERVKLALMRERSGKRSR